MSELSPQTQAVLDAYNAGFARPVAVHHKPRIAAALRAAADQLAYGHGSWTGTSAIIDEDKLLAIADELEAQ